MKKLGPYKLQGPFNVVSIPREVREALKLEKKGLVIWVIDEKGRCMLKKATMEVK